MTEAEWLTCTDPKAMLEFLWTKAGGSDRKLRLLGVACVRRIRHLLSEEASRKVVEVVERYGEGAATAQELMDAYDAATTVASEANDFIGIDALETWAACAAASTAYFDVHRIDCPEQPQLTIALFDIPIQAAKAAAKATARLPTYAGTLEAADDAEAASQARLLSCIFGNPFCPAGIGPAIFRWNAGTVVKLAQSIYDERAFDRLPVLADALEDAGCSEPQILDHCRGPGPHVRGCWVADLLLGKE